MIAELPQWEIELRGAPGELLDDVEQYKGKKCVKEYLIEGPGGTGKTRGIAEIILFLAMRYPGTRWLVVRETRESLAESFCQTFEQEVLTPDDPALSHASRLNRHSYIIRNRDEEGRTIEGIPCSEIVLGGLNKPENLYSTNYDGVYFVQAEQGSRDAWLMFRRALRNFGHPELRVQLLIADVNPDEPEHWLNLRADEGKMKRLLSRHTDNPAWYPAGPYRPPSEEGSAYVESLESLPEGVIKDRLYYGKWSAREGVVWANYNPKAHIIDAPRNKDGTANWKALGLRDFFGSIDWGHESPGCLQIWGRDGDKRMVMVAEVYRRNELLDWWTERICELDMEFGIQRIVCDPSRDDSIANVNDRLRQRGLPMLCEGADNKRTSTIKGDLAGLDLVRWGFEPDGSGIPRIRFIRDALRANRDQTLIARQEPWCTVMEIPRYVYELDASGKARGDITDSDCADHGCDALRYACAENWKRRRPGDEQRPPAKIGTMAFMLRHNEVRIHR